MQQKMRNDKILECLGKFTERREKEEGNRKMFTTIGFKI